MDKSIILLIAAGAVLAFLHIPVVVMTLGVILSLAMATIKICWTVVQSFAPDAQPVMQRRTAPVRN